MNARVAFYAPLKSPDHAAPSGDRTVARLYRRALEGAGFAVDTVSHLRSFDGAGDGSRQCALLAEAEQEADRLIADLTPAPPALWFTYHCHYKAPDLVGPRVTAALNIPYVIAEPSFSEKRAVGPWADFHAHAGDAIRRADLAIVVTRRDQPAVAALRGERLTRQLPPFLDVADHIPPTLRERRPPLKLITVAMMRRGDKLASYRILAEALGLLPAGWHLTIVGDGAARGEVEALFAPYADQIALAGLADERALASYFAAAELMVWPAVNEAYGMALLEGQAMGLPVVAGYGHSVADVVLEGTTGLLVPTGDIAAFAQGVRRFMDEPMLLESMGRNAQVFVAKERSLAGAVGWLRAALSPLCRGKPCAS